MTAVVILCTAPAEGDAAERLARGLIEARLAACVNLVPSVRSFYVWHGELQDDREVQLVIKTRSALTARVEQWLADNHPYEVPEFVVLDAARVAPSYLAWLLAQTDEP